MRITARMMRKGDARKALRALSNAVAGDHTVKVGWLSGEADSDVLQIATWNEFGNSRVPERPAFRNAIRANRDAYGETAKMLAQRIVTDAVAGKDDPFTIGSALDQLGAKAVGDVQREITSLSSPPNAPSTIRQKGSSNPLIDEGRLRQSVSWKKEG